MSPREQDEALVTWQPPLSLTFLAWAALAWALARLLGSVL